MSKKIHDWLYQFKLPIGYDIKGVMTICGMRHDGPEHYPSYYVCPNGQPTNEDAVIVHAKALEVAIGVYDVEKEK